MKAKKRVDSSRCGGHGKKRGTGCSHSRGCNGGTGCSNSREGRDDIAGRDT
jgi:hypothetical protein